MDRPRSLFVAGATGATGRTLLRLAGPDAPLVPHLRPATAAKRDDRDPRAVVLDLGNAEALEAALRRSTTVVQLIGTMRKRFASGDTYESSDIGTTRQLVEAGKKAGIDHVVLLSSVGAGSPTGAYLQAKAKAESLVRESGIPWTIFRPSAFVGEEHQPPKLLVGLARRLAPAKYRPIALEDLARAIDFVGRTRSHLGEVLEGQALWDVVAEAKRGG